MSWELRALTAINRSPLNAVVTTLERPGAHWAVQVRYANLTADQRARLQAFISSTRGAAQRFYVPVYGWTRRGSFPATEILSNNYFASGTTGWTSFSEIDATVADGIFRGTRTAVSTTQAVLHPSVNPTVTQYAPHVWRVHVSGKRYPVPLQADVQNNAASTVIASSSSTTESSNLFTLAFVPYETACLPRLIDTSFSGLMAGDYVDVAYTSLARCALVDNGPNFFQRSDEIDNAYWTKLNATATANAHTAPNGTVTAASLIENSSTAQHNVARTETRTSQAEDWCGFGYFCISAGTRNVRLVIGRDGTNWGAAIFQLSGSGAILSGPTNNGDATNARAFIKSVGNGWYYCAVVVRLTASTGLLLQADIASGTSVNYAGDGTSGIGIWRFGAAQSSVPTRGMQTTSAGDADGIAQTGGALYLKGLPASTNGLLLQGDPAEIITGSTSQLVRTRSPLNSDAAGLGYFEFEPPLRISPSDNAAVIIHNPMCRMMMESNVNGWTDRLGGFADLEFAAVEDVSP